MFFTDQMHRTIRLEATPQRIISLVPSQTELLFELGLGERVVGITKFCVHPKKWFRNKARVGGTKSISFEQITALQPDLIIANKEENSEAEIKALMELYPVWISDIENLADALEMIQGIGQLTETTEQAKCISKQIQSNFDALPQFSFKKAAYFIWQKPMMSINQSRFINDMMLRCGLENVFAQEVADYPEITPEKLQAASPETILLSSEPFPFQEKHKAYFQSLCPEANIILVDGEYFSWYGSRLLQATDYFSKLEKELH